jgi:hypothetical protein
MEDENTITLRRITQPLSKHPNLDDLLAQVTPENLHPTKERHRGMHFRTLQFKS